MYIDDERGDDNHLIYVAGPLTYLPPPTPSRRELRPAAFDPVDIMVKTPPSETVDDSASLYIHTKDVNKGRKGKGFNSSNG